MQAAMDAIVAVHKSDELMTFEFQPPFSELNEARSHSLHLAKLTSRLRHWNQLVAAPGEPFTSCMRGSRHSTWHVFSTTLRKNSRRKKIS